MPPTLSAILGQDRAVDSIVSAVQSDRLHHAWVFAGPKGVGKRTTAVAFASLVLDPTTGPDLMGNLAPEDDSPCQNLIEAGNHPDFIVVTKEMAALSADADIRNRKQTTIPKQVLVERLIEPSTLAGSEHTKGARARRVFVVDEAELMGPPHGNNPAQNALLKTLEEPPAGVIIVLVTSDEQRLLPTIRSRCQRVAFGRLDDAAMDAWRAGCSSEAVRGLDEASWAWVRDFATGSPGLALVAAETGLRSWAEALDPMLAGLERGRFAADFGKTAHDLVDGWAKENVKRREKAGDNPSKEAANAEALRHLVNLMAHRLRTRLRQTAQQGGDIEAVMADITALHEAERSASAHVPVEHAFDAFAARVAR